MEREQKRIGKKNKNHMELKYIMEWSGTRTEIEWKIKDRKS